MKTLIYDIEIFHVYDAAYQRRMYSGFIDTGVRMSADVSCISHFGSKWKGEKGAGCIDLTDFPSFDKKAPWKAEGDLLGAASEIIRSADHLVAHYGDKFDRRYLNAKFLQYKLPIIPPYPIIKQTDTCKLARSHLKLSSNRLDNLARFFQVELKKSKNWPDDWLKMTLGEKAAFKRVNIYCIGDVVCLDQVHDIMDVFSNNSPNMNLISEGNVCIRCGSKHYVNNGFYHTQKKSYNRFLCKDCGKVFHEGQFVK